MRAWLKLGSGSALCIALGALTGCGTEEETPMVDVVASTYASAQCEWARGCCEVAEFSALLGLDDTDSYSLEVVRGAQADAAKCEDVFHSSFVLNNTELLDSIRAGRIVVDEGALGGCADAYKSAASSCDVGVASGPAITKACDQTKIFQGQGAENAPCFHPLDCAEGNSCWVPAGAEVGICRAQVATDESCRSGDMCPDTDICKPADTRDSACAPLDLQPADAYCAEDAQCLPGLFCDSSSESCKAKEAEGGECTRADHCLSGRCNTDTRECEAQAESGDRCSSDAHCTDGLWCQPTSSSNAFCTAPLERGDVGDACNQQNPCAAEFVCAQGECQAPRAVGSLCDENAQCGDAGYCDNGSCVARLADGDDCNDSEECEPALYCDNTCEPRIDEGGDCAAAFDGCVEGTACDGADDTCRTLGVAGDSCSSWGCGTDLVCESFLGECADRVAAGAQCEGSSACPDNQFCDSSEAGFECRTAPTVGAGEDCDNETLCEGGLYCYGGTCEAPGDTQGADCDDTDLPCAAGFYCDGFYECQTKLANGTGCFYSEQCVAGSGCPATDVCTPYAAVNASCGASAAGALCDPDVAECVDNGVTEVCEPLASVGEDCTNIGCEPGLYCNNNSICVAPGVAGDNCGGFVPCADNFTCDAGTCVALGGTGDNCNSTNECGSGLSCQEFGGVCADRVAEGEGCALDDQCALGNECITNQTCTTRAAVDEECDADMPCAEGLRCDPEWEVCVVLEKPVALGERCQVNEQCASGVCDTGICTGACTGVAIVE